MPLPQWLARFNRDYVNPAAVRRGRWPVLVHTGRKTGQTRRTPIGAEPIEGGYLFFVNYGPETDWLQNVMASGSARLEIDGDSVELSQPRLLPRDAAYQLLDTKAKTPPSWVGLERCLVMTQV